MDLTWDLDDIARTSDDVAVRRRFNQRNLVWLIALLIFFLFVGFMQLVTQQRQNLPLDVLISALTFGLSASLLFAIWSRQTREWMKRRISAIAVMWVPVQFGLSLAFTRESDNWIAWACLTPLLMLGFRMLISELVLIHALLLAGGLFMLFVTRAEDDILQVVVSLVVINGLALLTELFMSRRMRRSVLDEWARMRSQAREQIRMRDELRYARELQLSMLPDCAPQLEWLDICATSVPATEVGGDYYDYFVGTGQVAIVCGDVAGHGMSAGLVLAAVRAGFTLLRKAHRDPADILRQLHELVAETSRRRMLVTMAVALLDRDARKVTLASAGHPPVLIRRADGTVETIDLWAAPLGVRLPLTIPQRSLDLAPGDAVILHSDGAYETQSPAGESYGLDRLAEAAGRAEATSAPHILTSILADIARFRGGAEMEDDMTVVVALVK